MSETPKGRPDVENNPKKPSVLREMGQAAAEAAGAVRDIVRTAKNGNGFAERLGINMENKKSLATGVYVGGAAAEGILSSDSSTGDDEKDSKEGSSNSLTPKVVEALRRDARVVVISTPEEQTSDSTEGASGSFAKTNIPVSEPPEPTSDELDRIKWDDYKRDAAAKRSVLVHPTTEEDLRELESFGVDIYSRYSPEVVSRYKGENVIDKEMFGTTIPNVDKPKKDDNPEGLTPYEQAMRAKYLGDEHDDAEKTEMSPEEHEAAANLKIARERFAKASIAAESHFFGKKKRQEALEAAAKELKERELEYMRLKFADKIEAAKQDPEKQAELAAEMAQAAFASMQETSRTTTDKYDSMLDDRGKFKKAAAKVGKWFNKGGKIAQWLKLGGAGFAVGATTAAFAGWPITVAVGVVTKLGVAGATKQAVLEEHRGEDRIDADASLGTIDPSFEKAVANMKIDDVMEHAVNVSVDNLKDVSIERRDALRKKVLSSSGKYAVGLVLGGLAGKYVGDWAASQSGGKELKTHLLEKVDNTKPGSVDPVGNYTPGLDSLYGYDPSKHEFLWQWAESVYGEGNGTSGIMHTVDVLRDNGYVVDIINNPNGSFSVVVDGVSDTEGLVKIFSQFVN